jgi:CheY-like chemotaxis protein
MNKAKILVVEDETIIAMEIEDRLIELGLDVLALVPSGEEAIQKAAEGRPDLVLMDIMLKGEMDGVQAAAEIRSRFNIPIIYLTAYADENTLQRAKITEPYAYLLKPFEERELQIAINMALYKHQMEQELRPHRDHLEELVAERTAELVQSNQQLNCEIKVRKQAEETLREYADRLASLREIDQAILEAQSPQAIAQAALHNIGNLIPCQRASIITFDFEAHELTILATYVNKSSEFKTNMRLPLNRFSITEELKQGQVSVVEDIVSLAHKSPMLQALLAKGIRSTIRVPLFSQGALIGCLNLGASKPGLFTTTHIEIAREVANQVAVASQQAGLYEEVQRQAASLAQRVSELQRTQAAERKQRELAETLREVSRVVNSSLEREKVLPVILAQLARVIEYDSASVMLLSDEALDIVARRSFRTEHVLLTLRKFEILPHVQQVLEGCLPLIIPDTTAHPSWVHLPNTEYIACWLGVPLLVQDRVIGLLNLNKEQAGFYSERHAELAVTFANQAAIAVKNARLFEQAQQEIKERLRAEAALSEERAMLAQRVTERTEELSAANAELSRAVRAKDEFLASMSHELRTPLNAILGQAELIQEGVHGPLTPRQLKGLRTIEESGRHLLALINDILEVAKIEADKIELEIYPMSVRAVCQASLRLIKELAHKKQLKLFSTLDSIVTTLLADERRLKQILINLLSNAVKFTPAGGQIGLEVKGDVAQEAVHFTVWDTGIGIAEEDMQRLFQRFVQVDSSLSRQDSGTGLGLALVRHLTEMHGGGIRVESEVGKGSRFTVSLPWSRGVSTLTERSLANSAPVVGKALIIEDDPIAAIHLAGYLYEQGTKTTIHPRAEGAIERVIAFQPDVIILDIHLPEPVGWDVLKQLKANPVTAEIPVVVVTMVDERLGGLALGAAGYLLKPVTRPKFHQALSRALSGLPSSQQPHKPQTAVVVMPKLSEEAPLKKQPLEKQPLILLAEDNETNINLISDYLTFKGYRFTIARNGFEAIERAKEERPDLILMDIQMPKMDGFETTRRMRADADLAEIPIIALTALAMPGDRERCLEGGADAYFPKPVSLRNLGQAIESHLGTGIK